eukprot:1871258-Alexandrium_andersonii.AAC.1
MPTVGRLLRLGGQSVAAVIRAIDGMGVSIAAELRGLRLHAFGSGGRPSTRSFSPPLHPVVWASTARRACGV